MYIFGGWDVNLLKLLSLNSFYYTHKYTVFSYKRGKIVWMIYTPIASHQICGVK